MDPLDIGRHKRALKQLEGNVIWQEIVAPKLAMAESDALKSLTDRGRTPQERDTFLEAYHLAKSLKTLVASHRDFIDTAERNLIEAGGEADEPDDE